MIVLRDFTAFYGDRTLIEHADTSFEAGRITALLGRNGSGKSTLLRAIAGLNRSYTGEVIIDGHADIASSPLRAKIVAFVNTSRARVANLRCRDVVALGRAPYTNWFGHMQPADESIVMESLRKVDMQSFADKTIDRISDGECQRVMIARALAQDTPAIVLDEPTSFLDLPNRYALCDILRHLAHESKKCILFSTHELDIALSMTDDIALIDTPRLITLPTERMEKSGMIERIFALPPAR